jgi:hypothetical protein
LERTFGVPNDPSKQQTGINFSNYDDIPVEASGQDVPEPATQFTNPPLDDHLLSNIRLANYKTPTPVQNTRSQLLWLVGILWLVPKPDQARPEVSVPNSLRLSSTGHLQHPTS